MPTVNGDFQNQATAVQTEEFGFKVTLPTITANQVITIDEDASAAPEDGAVVAVDTSNDPVTLTVEEVLPGAEIKVINTDGTNPVTLAGGAGVTISTNEAGLNIADANGVATLRHISDGNVVADGDLVA